MKRRRKILIAVLAMLIVAVLALVIRHYQLRWATESYIAQLKAQGEPMDIAQVLPPPVPPEQNAAPLITNALADIDSVHNFTNGLIFNNSPLAMDRGIPGRQLIGWQQSYIHNPTGDYPTNTWDDLGRQLAERQNDLSDFRILIKNPTLDFGYDYSDTTDYGFPPGELLPQLKYAAEWLKASDLYNLHEGKTTKACNDVRAMLGLAKGEIQERFVSSQEVRMNIVCMAADGTWDIIQATNVSDNDLAPLQQDWRSLEFIESVKQALLTERIRQIRAEEHYQKSPHELWEGVTPDFDGMVNTLFEAQWLWFWSCADEKRAANIYQVIIDADRMAETNGSFQGVELFARTKIAKLRFDSFFPDTDSPPFYIDLDTMATRVVFSVDATDSFCAVRRAAKCETVKNIVIAAIALKRYEIRYNRLPDTLAKLVPDLLPSVPIDFMDGKPLRYRLNSDRTFLLYSIGFNGKDDGGNPALTKSGNDEDASGYYWLNPYALDWVWPQPATEKEIQDYYAHPPR